MSATALDPAETYLPLLRPDVRLLAGPVQADGAPSYTLFDPVTGVYHKLEWREAEVVGRLRRPVRLDHLLAALRRALPGTVSAEEVLEFCKHLHQNRLTALAGVNDPETLEREAKSKELKLWRWLVHHDLYFRSTLLRPGPWLEQALPAVRWAVSTPALLVYLLAGLAGLFFLAVNPERYVATFSYFFNWQGVLVYAAAMILVKTVHEFAHAFTAAAFGIPVRSMGVAFIVFWPVPFCNITDAWRLRRGWDRARVGLAGVLAEAVLAGLALCLWGACPPGVMKSVCFVLSSASLFSTLAVNLNPAMRFDGYYIASDLWGVENLQSRAYALTRWRLRRFFFGSPDPAPETGVAPRRQAAFMAYSLYSWLYRLGLYLGIAVLVYHKFTKVIGVLMFAVEILWFIALPLAVEVRQTAASLGRTRFNPRLGATLAALLALILWLGLPLPRREALPGVIEPAASQFVYAPGSGRVAELNLKEGQIVRPGERLVEIVSAQRQAQLAGLRLERRRVEREQARLAASEDEEERAYLPQQVAEIARLEAQIRELEEWEALDRPAARIAGEVVWVDKALRVDGYVKAKSLLGRVAALDHLTVTAYAPEELRLDLRPGAQAWFVPADRPGPRAARLVKLSPVRAERLEHRSLSSEARGPLATRQEGNHLVLLESCFRVDAELAEPWPEARLGQTGRLWIETQPRSRLADWLRTAWRVLLRESGV